MYFYIQLAKSDDIRAAARLVFDGFQFPLEMLATRYEWINQSHDPAQNLTSLSFVSFLTYQVVRYSFSAAAWMFSSTKFHVAVAQMKTFF